MSQMQIEQLQAQGGRRCQRDRGWWGGCASTSDARGEKSLGWRVQKIVERHGLKKGILEDFSWPFLYFVMTVFDFDRHYDLSHAQEVGFEETIDTLKSFEISFERMREAKIIP